MGNNNDFYDPTTMELKDTDKYVRQIGSKALLPTSRIEADEYEQKRAALLSQKRRLDSLEEKMKSLEMKIDRMITMLETVSHAD